MSVEYGIDWDSVQAEAVAALQALLRLDTTNPPGHEGAAAELLAAMLEREGFEPVMLAAETGRDSIIARLPGSGERGPLLLQGHSDVVLADPAEWSHPPFGGEIDEGYIWGRGALDMKGTVIMQLFAFILAKRLGLRPRGDVIFCCVADEEAGGRLGAVFLVEEHPELVRAEIALGEVGGYTFHAGPLRAGGRDRHYPIQVTEKVGCSLTLRVTGASGHGSLPIRDGAMAKTARVLQALTGSRLPMHITPVAERFVRTLAGSEPALLALLDPARSDAALAELGRDGRMFEAILHNTATPTIVRGGSKGNVIPGQIEINVDGRLLPRQRAEEFVEEVRALIGDDAEITHVRHTPSLTETEPGGYFDELGAIVAELDPGAVAVPAVLSAVTDARTFARLGAQTYGFAPVQLDESTPFWSLFHSADERIPIAGLLFGLKALFRAVERY